jgi:hypothetical protein
MRNKLEKGEALKKFMAKYDEDGEMKRKITEDEEDPEHEAGETDEEEKKEHKCKKCKGKKNCECDED